MTSLDFLYIVIALSLLILTSFLATLLWQAQKTLKSANDILLDVQDITHDIRALKQQTKTGALGVTKFIISAIRDYVPMFLRNRDTKEQPTSK